MAKFHDLYEAVMACDCARLRQLVQEGIDINCRDSMKRTVLHHAAKQFWGSGMKDIIQTLVELGADIDAVDMERKTPLHYYVREIVDLMLPQSEHSHLTDFEARSRLHIAAVKFLIKLGADINAQFDCGVTSLHRAIQRENIQGIKTLLRLGVDVNAGKVINFTALHSALDPTDSTLLKGFAALGADVNSSCTLLPPLLKAVELGRMDIIKMLVQYGAKTVDCRKDNLTPIIVATNQRLPDTVRRLAQLGADLNAIEYTSTTVNEVVKVGRVDILEYLVQQGDLTPHIGSNRITALGSAIFLNRDEMVECLLVNGADVNVRYDEEISSLVTAMRLGDIDMVKAIAKLARYQINSDLLFENMTALHTAHNNDIKTMKLLIRYGGDVNVKYNAQVRPVHDAIARRDEQILRVLDQLGANLNARKLDGISVLHFILTGDGSQDLMPMIKLLVEAGLDLNQCSNWNVTPLHDAVRLGDANMVQILGELKADVNAKRTEGDTPFLSAIVSARTDVVRYFARNGANVNSRITLNVTPLHDAVHQGNVDMLHVLINSGADTKCYKNVNTALGLAENNEVVTCLLECGADVNAKVRWNISPLHDAVEKSDLEMISELAYSANTTGMRDKISLLYHSVHRGYLDITETLLKSGADMNSLQDIPMTPLDVAFEQGKVECAFLLISRNARACRDTSGSSPLHQACQQGHIDQARLLIIEGSDVSKLDYLGRRPFECLPLANTADYHVLQETAMALKVKETVSTSFVSTLGCQHMATSLQTPGTGNVHCISSPSAREIAGRVNKLLQSVTQQCKAFSGKKLKPIGSVAEGTRVGLPNEMDFLFEVPIDTDEESKLEDLGNGFAKYRYVGGHQIRIQQAVKYVFPDLKCGSAEFHSNFIDEVIHGLFDNEVSHEKVSTYSCGGPSLTDTNRKACSLLLLKWNDGMSFFIISVDIVPCLHIDSWPEGATTRTWLMDEQELYSRGYVLVPKPPHVKSDLGKECTEEELHTLWKISFPHLETEHMQRLEQRIKDVYITAKCLKNPDVCRIMITDDGSLPRSVGRYVTSYMLKMCFFQNVDFFRKHHMSLEEMVCKVYDDLVIGLSKNFIPIFFLPNVSALNGVKVDVPKSAKVAKIMARFVRALYLRDSLGEITDGGDDLVMTVYQRNPGSVYRVYDISNEDV